MNSASLEGRPSGPLDARTDSASLEAPSAEPSTGPQCGGNLRLVQDYPRRTEATAQPPRWTGRIYSPTTPRRVADGVSRRQLALAIMPHNGHDRRLISLHPPLCRYSRRGAGLWSSVRTCLTPPATVSPTPCTFPLRRTFRGHGRRHSNAVRLLIGARFGRQHPRRLTSSDVGFRALL